MCAKDALRASRLDMENNMFAHLLLTFPKEVVMSFFFLTFMNTNVQKPQKIRGKLRHQAKL